MKKRFEASWIKGRRADSFWGIVSAVREYFPTAWLKISRELNIKDFYPTGKQIKLKRLALPEVQRVLGW